MTEVRLQRYLSQAGVCSRREGERMIRDGRVRVGGRVVTEMGTRIDPDAATVEVDGRPVRPGSPPVYIALHKPAGVVTSCRQTDAPVVVDLVDVPERLIPVGRLDKDSTGLVILTSDGRLHHRLLHPSFEHEKEYEVELAAPMADGALRKMAEGLPMMGGRTRPARIRRLSETRFRIVLTEGKNRQIRRMVRKVGGRVRALRRIRMANVRLGALPPGKWRHLSAGEVAGLLRAALGRGPEGVGARKRAGRPGSAGTRTRGENGSV